MYQLGLGFRLLISRLWRGSRYGAVKGRESPVLAGSMQRNGKTLGGWPRLRWALDEELVEGWGTRGQCLAAVVWASWLVVLAVKDTGDGEFAFVCLCLKRIEISSMIS